MSGFALIVVLGVLFYLGSKLEKEKRQRLVAEREAERLHTVFYPKEQKEKPLLATSPESKPSKHIFHDPIMPHLPGERPVYESVALAQTVGSLKNFCLSLLRVLVLLFVSIVVIEGVLMALGVIK